MSAHPENTNNATEKIQLVPGLYLVSTPIGNMRDITLRALDVLKTVDIILCEDTRHTGKLLSQYSIKNRLKSYHDHTPESVRQRILADLEAEQRIALVSDAGTPLISDPGFKLVREALDKGVRVIPVPGANAVLPALQMSGAGTDKFCFLGFLPAKTKARRKKLKEFASISAPIIMYETSPRLLSCLKDCYSILGDRKVTLAREITKRFEETMNSRLSSLIERLDESAPLKGEIVLVIEPQSPTQITQEKLHDLLKQEMKEHSMKDAVKNIVEISGMRKKEIYELALQLQNDNEI